MEELITTSLEKDIAAATAAAVASAADEMTSFAASRAASWGKSNDPSHLLNRVRRAPGHSVLLATLCQEAPPELKLLMKEGQAFATWLRHRTGLLEVKGLPGEEFVVWVGSVKETAAEQTDFAFNPQATEFNPMMFGDMDCNYDYPTECWPLT
ncbi:unnamed protein product [Effrenium voratum]|nr:unnamed protein product [Effrenium voratum]